MKMINIQISFISIIYVYFFIYFDHRNLFCIQMLYYVRSLIRKCECGFVTFLCLNKPTGQCKFCINVVKDTEKSKEKSIPEV